MTWSINSMTTSMHTKLFHASRMKLEGKLFIAYSNNTQAVRIGYVGKHITFPPTKVRTGSPKFRPKTLRTLNFPRRYLVPRESRLSGFSQNLWRVQTVAIGGWRSTGLITVKPISGSRCRNSIVTSHILTRSWHLGLIWPSHT